MLFSFGNSTTQDRCIAQDHGIEESNSWYVVLDELNTVWYTLEKSRKQEGRASWVEFSIQNGPTNFQPWMVLYTKMDILRLLSIHYYRMMHIVLRSQNALHYTTQLNSLNEYAIYGVTIKMCYHQQEVRIIGFYSYSFSIFASTNK